MDAWRMTARCLALYFENSSDPPLDGRVGELAAMSYFGSFDRYLA